MNDCDQVFPAGSVTDFDANTGHSLQMQLWDTQFDIVVLYVSDHLDYAVLAGFNLSG